MYEPITATLTSDKPVGHSRRIATLSRPIYARYNGRTHRIRRVSVANTLGFILPVSRGAEVMMSGMLFEMDRLGCVRHHEPEVTLASFLVHLNTKGQARYNRQAAKCPKGWDQVEGGLEAPSGPQAVRNSLGQLIGPACGPQAEWDATDSGRIVHDQGSREEAARIRAGGVRNSHVAGH